MRMTESWIRLFVLFEVVVPYQMIVLQTNYVAAEQQQKEKERRMVQLNNPT